MDRDTPQSRKKVQKHLNEKISLVSSNSISSDMSVEELFSAYRVEWELTVRNTSKRIFRSIDKNLLKLFPKGCIVNNIDRLLLQKIVNAIFAKNYANETLNKYYTRLKNVYKYGMRIGCITKNEIEFVKYHKNKRVTEVLDSKYLDKKDVKKIVDYFNQRPKNYHHARMVSILYQTGMRYGELCGLREQDIDWENNIIHINGTYDYVTKTKGATKTVNSHRDVVVTDGVLELINETLINNAMKFYKTDNKEKYIFITKSGSPLPLPSFNTVLGKAGESLGFNFKITSHLFRHAHISLLAEMRVPIKQIMDRVGHSDSKMTLEIYSHVTSNMKKELTEKLDNFVL
ncbi:tyrosine-type recombinase/integrase [Streptococcus ictaluri]|uniref:Site-specific recombinase, phage integrase family n=1 Tax=Streptococcus ictaluri 707-05 TaxID=764299 RepID=G5K0X7_9STRE|nr:site-specific integrase [Streptococcus ictaluri]EHI70371.1 site-specific recombinase, phage integrase family [Streptococcus ictaluri 707-05]